MKKYKNKITEELAEQIEEDDFYKVSNSWERIPKRFIEKSNDWEEIIEKDYLILEIKSGGYHWIYDEKTKKYVCTRYGVQHSLDAFCKKGVLNSGYFIFKVKRLSDNEIFTVGDKCNGDFIEEIKLVVNENRLYFSSKNLSWNKSIKDLIKDKISLFTTEDGKEMYEGNEFFKLITPAFYNKSYAWNILPNKINSNIIYDQKNNKKNGKIWFSTKEAAQEWIVLNKPCLSLNDVLQHVNILSKVLCEDDLKKLVKSKIND